MTDRPIIFSGPMVRALLAGRKTQTRRLGTSPLRRVEVGDRLWVRESGWIAASGLAFQPYAGNEGDAPCSPSGEPYRARPSIHMPRWASRLTLIVEDVKVERLQEICEEDAIAEGIELHSLMGASGWTDYGDKPGDMTRRYFADPRRSFQSLWQSLHGADAWDANPFVVGLTFRIGLGNIDRIAA